MNVLAMDTSGPVCGVAISRDGSVTAALSVMNRHTHSVNLLPMIQDAMDKSDLTREQIHRVAVVVGPGSFTGVRIGVSTAKGICHGLNIPAAPVDALEAMAYPWQSFDGVVCPMQDARAGQVYAATFQQGHRLMDDVPVKLTEFLSQVQMMGMRCLFTGDGMVAHRTVIREIMGDQALFAPDHLAYVHPGAVAELGARREDTLDYLALMPLYLRKPNAVMNRKLVEAQGE